jgi:ATPase subunit of ABC transporter with duplicated ATPase domains
MVQLPHTLNPVTSLTLQVRGLEIRKGGTTILTDFTWRHQPGEVAWVVGENGAGKSSFLRVLSGRNRPAAGSVSRSGKIGQLSDLIYYHPDMGLPDFMTVADWHLFVERVIPAGARYPIEPGFLPGGVLPHKRVERLSTGEAKRLALYALLSRDAPFLILDEPFEHLSREGKELLAAHLGRRAATRVVIVATNQEIPAPATGPALRYDGDRLTTTNVWETSS